MARYCRAPSPSIRSAGKANTPPSWCWPVSSAELASGRAEPFVAVCIWVTGASTILSGIAYSGYGSSTWPAMSLSLRRYRRARAIRSRSRPDRVRGPVTLVSLGALILDLRCRGAHGVRSSSWVVPAVLLDLRQHP